MVATHGMGHKARRPAMAATASRRMARIMAGAAGFGALALMALPAAAGVHGPAVPASQAQRAERWNTGATHSPQVLRQLAGATVGGRRASPLPGALQGVDVASFQHPNGQSINWTQVAQAGIQFAGVKATEGAYYRNPYALTDLAQAKAAGLSVMAYAFAIPNGNGSSASPSVQANYLLTYLAKAGSPLPVIMLDIEYNPYGAECYGLSQSAMVTWIKGFDAAVRAKTGEEPIIYTPAPWWQKCTGGVATFRQLPLWVPDYSSATSPTLPAGWTNWGFWQYSSTGTVSGINTPGGTDLDQLNPNLIPLLDPGTQHSTAGTAVSLQIKPADPVTGQTLSFTATGLPAGLSISAGGLITGTPSTAGTSRATIKVTDGHGHSGAVSFGWTVK
jgi:GH25 family lysozyme M1 (1,4-beta-N-acetylmuramidase)